MRKRSYDGTRLPTHFHRPGKPWRARREEILRPPDQQHEILHNQRRAESREKLEQFRRTIDAAQQQDLEQCAEQPDKNRGQSHPAPEPERSRESIRQRKGEIGAEHEECAVGEVHNARHAEDERKAGGHEKQRSGARKSREKLNDEELHPRGPQKRGGGRGLRFVSVLRAKRLHFCVAGQVVRALVVRGVDHHALAVLASGFADERAHRRLMVDGAEGHWPERGVK